MTRWGIIVSKESIGGQTSSCTPQQRLQNTGHAFERPSQHRACVLNVTVLFLVRKAAFHTSVPTGMRWGIIVLKTSLRGAAWCLCASETIYKHQACILQRLCHSELLSNVSLRQKTKATKRARARARTPAIVVRWGIIVSKASIGQQTSSCTPQQRFQNTGHAFERPSQHRACF